MIVVRIKSGKTGTHHIQCLQISTSHVAHKDAVNILGKALSDARTALAQASSEDSQQRLVNLSVFRLCLVSCLGAGCFPFLFSKDWSRND